MGKIRQMMIKKQFLGGNSPILGQTQIISRMAADPGRIGKEAKQIGIKTLRCFAP